MALTELFGKKLDGKRTLIVAELGIEHKSAHAGRRLGLARVLLQKAAAAGADAAKFQLFVENEPLFCQLPGDEKRQAAWDQSVMHSSEWKNVNELARELKIPLFFSVFQPTAVKMCLWLGVPAWKVASRAAKTFPYGDVPGPFIVSNGFGLLPDWVELPPNAITLQCCPKYPSSIEESLWRGDTDGLSDHSGTIYPAIDAIINGAKLVELHVGLGRTGPHDSAIGFKDLAWLCDHRDKVAALRKD